MKTEELIKVIRELKDNSEDIIEINGHIFLREVIHHGNHTEYTVACIIKIF